MVSPGIATLAGWAGSGMNLEARGKEGTDWDATAAGKPSNTAEPGSCLLLSRLAVINCEVLASLIKSSCAKSSFAEITGNSSERTKTRLTSPDSWVRRLLPRGAAQWTNAPTVSKTHSKLRDASSVMCTQGRRSRAASTAVCVQGTEKITSGKAARASPLMISRSLTTLRTVHRCGRRKKLRSSDLRAAFCLIAKLYVCAGAHVLT